ncbi:MAG: MATE family efflux transporter [Bacteroidales bacterium]|nr:MATE family efflux transporter [Bacteroidales bacterium]
MDFTKGNIGRSIFVFSVPIILGNLFQQLYSLVNSIFVGKYLGVEELAAVGSTYPVVFFITSMVLGIGSGGSVAVSHYYGAKDYESIHKIISTFYIFFILLGLVICIFGIVSADCIFAMLGLNQQVRTMAVEYFRIYMAGMFFSVIFHSAVSILRGLGDSVTQLWFLIPANILNIVLSYLFLGVMNLGIEASAFASLISQFCAFAALFIFLGRKHEFVKLPSIKNLFFSRVYLRQIVSIGVPTGLQQSIVSLTQILILFLVTSFGTDAIAGYSAAVRVESIALIFVLNIAQALTSFTGTNLGAGLSERSKQGLKTSIKLMGIVALVTLIIFCFGSRWLIGLFTTEQAVIEIGSQYLVVDGLFWFLFGVMMTFTAYFRGAGYAFVTLVISFITLWLARFPISWYLSSLMGVKGIWLGAPLAWLLSIIIYLIYYKKKNISNSKIVKS